MKPSPSRRNRSRRLRALAASVAVLAVAGGCVDQDPPGVGVQKLAADIVFGVKEAPPDVPPANLSPGQAGDFDPTTFVPPSPVSASPLPGQGTINSGRPRRPTSRLPRPTPLNPAKSPCPPAALTAFPAAEAGLNITAQPVEGQYRWKRDGKQTVATLPGVALPVGGFEQRLVRNVRKISDTEYSFETVQPELGTGITVLQTFKVKTAAVSRSVEPPVESLPVAPPALPVEPPVDLPVERPTLPSARVGDPERGISLARIERVDQAGNSQVLEFTPAVLYLPLPIEPGESWSAVGIDARTGQVFQNQARVLRRERVDACGEVVDGWAVESTQTFSGAGTGTRTYRYIVAPQLGGTIISEELHVAGPSGTTDVTFSLGQLKPAPLPVQQSS